MGLWWLGFWTALAETPVLYEEGSADDAVSAVMQRTGLPADQLLAQHVGVLIQRPPVVLGDAVVRHCAGQPSTTMTEIRAEIARARAALEKDASPGAALDHLDLAIAGLGCLRELAEPQPLAELFILRAALAADHQPDVARAELRSALSFSADVSWPEGYPPAGAALLDEARANGMPHTLSISPPCSQSGPWLDGQTIPEGDTVSVGAGLHLLQTATTAGFQSAWLVIGGDAKLVLPERYRHPLLERAREPAGRAELGWLLAAGTADFQAGYIRALGGLWLVTVDGAALQVEELVAPPPPAAPAPEKAPWWRRLVFWRRSE